MQGAMEEFREGKLGRFNAVGDYTPKLVIHMGATIQESRRASIPRDTTLAVSSNSWIKSELFFRWGELFVANLPHLSTDDPFSQLPHLLVFDGHSTHVQNLPFLHLMEVHNVHVYIIPSHTSHWLQPADKTLFASLKEASNSLVTRRQVVTVGGPCKNLSFLRFSTQPCRGQPVPLPSVDLSTLGYIQLIDR